MCRLVAFLAAGVIVVACGGSDEVGSGAVVEADQASDAGGGDEGTTEPDSSEPSPDDATSVSDADVTVVSDDGILEVFVPAGSGPSDVTIVPIELADAEVQSIGYELGPDGAVFSEPVTLTFSLPADDWVAGDGVPLLIFASDSEDVPPATVSRDGEVVTVTADINHLTSFVVVDDGAWVVTLRPDPVSVPADGSGQVDVDLVSKRGAERFADEDLSAPEFLEVTWSVDDPSFTVTPSARPRSSGSAGPTANVSCTEIGADTSVRVEFDLLRSQELFKPVPILFAGVKTFVELDVKAAASSRPCPTSRRLPVPSR